MAKSLCGVFECGGCGHKKKGNCSGCLSENKSRVNIGEEPCGIYACAGKSNIERCDKCADAVCNFTRDLELANPIRARLEKKRCYSRKLSEHFADRRFPGGLSESTAKIPEKTIDRLQAYILALDEFVALGINKVSSSDLSRKTAVKDYLIRRDLSQFGAFGRPSIGYDTKELRGCISKILSLDQDKQILWVGALHIAAEPALLERFADYNFRIAALLDPEPELFGGRIGTMDVLPLERLAETVKNTSASGAIIATPPEIAQDVADDLVRAGISGILNLSAVGITAPARVCVRNVNIVGELLSLSFYCRRLHEARSSA